MTTDPSRQPPSPESLLAMLDQLRYEADRVAGMLTTALGDAAPDGSAGGGTPGGAAELRSGVPFRGEDSSGAVRVAIDQMGKVVDVELADSWPRTVGPARLADALMEAVADGERRRATAWGSAVAEGVTGIEAAPDAGASADRISARHPAPGFTPYPMNSSNGDRADVKPPAASPTDPSAQLFARDLLDLIWEADRQMDEFVRLVDEGSGREVVGRGGGGRASVTVRGGAVVHIELDTGWLATADRSAVVAEIRTAFDAAHEAAAKASDEALTAVEPIAELQEMTADFETLLGRLGLGGRNAGDGPR
jgi:DNA-binding protein YbaB